MLACLLYYSDLIWLPTTTSSADSPSRTGFAPCRQQELSWLGGKARWFGRLWRAGCVLWCGAWGVRVWVRDGGGWVVLLYVSLSCPHPVHYSRSRRHHRHLLPFDYRRRFLVLVSRSRPAPSHLVVEALRYPWVLPPVRHLSAQVPHYKRRKYFAASTTTRTSTSAASRSSRPTSTPCHLSMSASRSSPARDTHGFGAVG